ncbi:glycoprotein [Saccharopolyspora elongata]|uniref:Glycoprotein n=1 Tax=Saccharopolyspora elongata TaxID=2530387 RepID=A0A4R4ZEK4_9PSEU|nr:glycoprotein [Saccharopolyspora elongata]TDD56775.1 glycoprotein [Saccharopolyspora elongata]
MRFLLAALVAVLLCAMVPLVPAPQAAAQGESPTVLDVTKITPSVVGAGSPGEVVITGRLTNTSDHQINNVEARVQRGNATTTEPAVQRALRDDPATVTEPAFTSVADRLAPGQQIPVELRIPLTGPNSLQLSQPGVYPLLVNVNGAPSGGGRARIAQAQFLLPVLATPGGEQARPGQPTETSMLVPIVDFPRLEREAIGGMPAVLVDDQLSASLAPGGRLYDLVQAVTDRAGPGSPVGNALCFAVDPDLLITARAMKDGYLVRQPDNSLVEGIGAGAAGLWLSKLREATNGRCVMALPYADADIVALGRAGLPDLVKGALDGASLLRDPNILGVEPRGLLWPVEGSLADPAIADLPRTALLEPRALNLPAGSLSPVRVRGQNMAAVPIDPLLTSALDPLHDTELKVTTLSPPQNGQLSAQNALGALAFRATQGQVPGATSVLAPPRRWNLRGDDLRALLDGMQQLHEAGLIRLTPVPEPDPATLPEADLDYPVDAGSAEIPQPVLDQLAAQNFKVGDLYVSSQEERSSPVQRGQVTTPLRNGLLRGTASAWRGKPDAARQWVDRATGAINDVLRQVRVEYFEGQVTRIDSADSPIPLTVVNDLPITVSVVFRIPQVPGVQVQHDFGGPVTVPANGRRPVWLPTNAQRAGKFTIDVTVTTPQGGTQFDTTKRLQIESTNYGSLIPMLTGIAAAVLVLMSAMRIIKRALARRRRAETAASADAAEPVEPTDAATNGAPQDSTPEAPHIATTDGDRNRN